MPETSPRMALFEPSGSEGGDAKGSQRSTDRYERRLPVGRANPSALQENVRELLTAVISGRSSGVSLAKRDPDGSWLKMYQDSFQSMMDGSLEKWSMTWPKWGTLLDGVVTGLSMSEPCTEETESLLWLTPSCVTIEGGEDRVQKRTEYRESIGRHYVPGCLAEQVKWPTPNANHADTASVEGARYSGKTRPEGIYQGGGSLNPMWVEWLMGFPNGWTDLNVSEMP